MKDKVLIKVENLKKHYNGGKVKALDGVNCHINRGEVVVIIGPSGSGKSTLLRSLNLLEIPTSGKILLDDVDITNQRIILIFIDRRWEWCSSTLTFLTI